MLNTPGVQYGPRGMAYLQACHDRAQDGALAAAQNHQGNPGNTNHDAHQSVLSGLRTDADHYTPGPEVEHGNKVIPKPY